MNIIHFFKYNNTVSIAFIFILLGAGSIFAASPDAREAAGDFLVGKETRVISVDNSALLFENFDVFSPVITIVGLEEDAERYLIIYRYTTFIVADNAWRKTEKESILRVSKAALGGADLTVYIKEELTEVATRDLAYLKEAQEKERNKGETSKVTVTRYTGLLGLVIDPKEEEEKERQATLKQGEAEQNFQVPISLPEANLPSVDNFQGEIQEDATAQEETGNRQQTADTQTEEQPADTDLAASLPSEPQPEPQQPEEQPALETQNEAAEPPADTDLAATPPSEPQPEPTPETSAETQ